MGGVMNQESSEDRTLDGNGATISWSMRGSP
jgi:hypothetical protein